MKLGVDIFSLRYHDWDVFQYLQYAHDIGLDVVHFSEMDSFDNLDTEYLREVRRSADALNLSLEVGMGSICPTSTTFSGKGGTASEQLSQRLKIAAELGSPAVRCYLGSNADRFQRATGDRRTSTPFSKHMEATVATCRSVRDECLDLGIKIAIENHAGDMQGRELKQLIEAAGPDFVGACIDSGNPLWVAESPFITLEHLAPYVVMSHIRDTAVWPHPRGAVAQWVAMGDGTVGIDAWSKAYQERCPDTNFTLEIITSIPPRVLPYLEPEFWEIYQDTPAAEFSQFLALVAAGTPYTLPLFTKAGGDMPDAVREALAIQQRAQLEKSVQYCRETLGIGRISHE